MTVRLPDGSTLEKGSAVSKHLETPMRILQGVVRSTHPLLGQYGGRRLGPSGAPWRPPPGYPWLSELNKPFDLARFAKVRRPLPIQELRLFTGWLPAPYVIWTMLLKMPGTDYRLPFELDALGQLVQTCADIEQAVNPDIDDCYVYITVDRSHVIRGERQRSAGAHSDGIQGPRFRPKLPADHTYVWTDMAPPRFFTHPFDFSGLSPDKDWLDRHFAEQLNRNRSEVIDTHTLVMADSYCVHEAMATDREGIRTFVRINVSRMRYDRLGNTLNAMFNYDGWRFVPRPAPAGLRGGPY